MKKPGLVWERVKAVADSIEHCWIKEIRLERVRKIAAFMLFPCHDNYVF